MLEQYVFIWRNLTIDKAGKDRKYSENSSSKLQRVKNVRMFSQYKKKGHLFFFTGNLLVVRLPRDMA